MSERFRLHAKWLNGLAPLRITLACALTIAMAMPAAQAQSPSIEPPTAPTPAPVEPPAELPPPQAGDPTQTLDRLFAALRAAPSDESAKYIEGLIWAQWSAAGGDIANLLMSRARTALQLKDIDLSLKLLTAIVDIRPDYVEAWNRRATVYFVQRNFGAAMADLHNVLAREPRHFGAWASLGLIMQELGADKLALSAFRRALDLHPRLERIPDLAKKLAESVEGRDI